MRQYELIDTVKSYDPLVDEELLNRAYVFSMKAHGGQTRASGMPFFSHPLEVAGILTQMKLDSASIAAALLHDTLEDTVATPQELSRLFGDEVTFLVNGVTKLSRLEWQSEQAHRVDNYRKLVLASAEDIRVLLIKLADRLHNIRTLHHIKSPKKRRTIAIETLEIYAPLAERMGMQSFQNELEALSFAELHPDINQVIKRKLHERLEESRTKIEDIVLQLQDLLARYNIKAQILGREKTPYSIFMKMRMHKFSFEQLNDVLACRVIVEDKDNCYKVLGILHSDYSLLPGMFKDYIGLPKANNYQSLHTGIIGPYHQRVEIQIRTVEMHEIAEFGLAAHWKYKRSDSLADPKDYHWLRNLLEVIENADTPEEFLEYTRIGMFQDEVFCFTPQGDLISLPKGATAIDFAYATSSEAGNKCTGVKINGKIMPLRTVLSNGSTVEIITSRNSYPAPAWEKFAVTPKAKTNIRKFIRVQQRKQYIILGRMLLQKICSKYNVDISDKTLRETAIRLAEHDWETMLEKLGKGEYIVTNLLKEAYPHLFLDQKSSLEGKKEPQNQGITYIEDTLKGWVEISVAELTPGVALHYANCCHPLPGDIAVGIMSAGKGIIIHTKDCKDLYHSVAEEAPQNQNDLKQFSEQLLEQIVNISWSGLDNPLKKHIGRLYLAIAKKPASFMEIFAVLESQEVCVVNIKFIHRTEDLFEVMIDLELNDNEQLDKVIFLLKSLSIVYSVERNHI